ncbi:MAG: hypothetical protein KC910_01290 [Candidatus Eremiobacteraeota bacterium]|nr:hypothetical protein [Candidatus Eremiobacteraeota bacterium]
MLVRPRQNSQARVSISPRSAPPKSEQSQVFEPVDLVAAATPEPTPSPTGWKRSAACLGLALLSGVSALAGIGYYGNREALREPISVSFTLDSELAAAVSPDQGQGQQARPRGKVAVAVPARQATDFAQQLRGQPHTRALLRQALERVKTSVDAELQGLSVPPDRTLLDLKAPLPTSERAFLHLGGANLPSLGYGALQTESVPLTLDYQVAPFTPALEVDLQLLDQQPPQANVDGVYLGSVKVGVRVNQPSHTLTGQARLELDLEGRDSRAAAEELKARPDSDANRRQLEKLGQRLEQGRRLAAGPAADLLQDAFHDQRVDFAVRLDSGQGELASSVYHFWLGPDTNGDGRADLVVREQTSVEGLARLELHLDRLEAVGQAPEGWVGGFLHGQVEDALLAGVRQLVPSAAEQVKTLAAAAVEGEFHQASRELEDRLNPELAALYGQGRQLHVKVGDQTIKLPLGAIRADRDGVVLAFGRGASRVEPGQGVSLSVGAQELAQALRDSSQGGSVDWRGLLAQVRQANGLKRLDFGQRDGKTIYPRLVQRPGETVLKFDLTAEFKSFLGIPGLPVLDPVLGLGRWLLGATIHTGVEIPLALETQDGVLGLRAVDDQVRFVQAETTLPFSPIRLLPTRLVGDVLANLLVKTQGGTVGAGLREARLRLDLREDGLRFEEARWHPSQGLDLKIGVTDEAVRQVDRLVGQ